MENKYLHILQGTNNHSIYNTSASPPHTTAIYIPQFRRYESSHTSTIIMNHTIWNLSLFV